MNGIINLYKEKGITSFKQINMLKQVFPGMKIGHTGTLDPIAEGVLIVCVGKATRIADYIQCQKKVYLTEMILGLSTDSYDITGKELSKEPAEDVSNDEIVNVIKTFIKKQSQKPPIYSAKKVKGKKLYQYAFENKDVEIKESNIEILSIEDININNILYQDIPMKKISFKVECSKGTYIRSLCHDIGKSLNKYGTMSGLIRLQVGNFGISDSKKINEIINLASEGKINELLTPIEKAINLRSIYLNLSDVKKYVNGVKIQTEYNQNDYIIREINDHIIGIGKVDENGILKGKVMLDENYK